MRFKVKVDQEVDNEGEFEITQCKVENNERTKLRTQITMFIAAGLAIAMAISGAYSLYIDDFGPLQTCWSETKPLVYGLIGFGISKV